MRGTTSRPEPKSRPALSGALSLVCGGRSPPHPYPGGACARSCCRREGYLAGLLGPPTRPRMFFLWGRSPHAPARIASRPGGREGETPACPRKPRGRSAASRGGPSLTRSLSSSVGGAAPHPPTPEARAHGRVVDARDTSQGCSAHPPALGCSFCGGGAPTPPPGSPAGLRETVRLPSEVADCRPLRALCYPGAHCLPRLLLLPGERLPAGQRDPAVLEAQPPLARRAELAPSARNRAAAPRASSRSSASAAARACLTPARPRAPAWPPLPSPRAAGRSPPAPRA